MEWIRKKLARWMAKTALKLDPECSQVKAYYAKQLFDLAVLGGAITHIDYDKVRLIEDKETE